jgi:hypothetical protein
MSFQFCQEPLCCRYVVENFAPFNEVLEEARKHHGHYPHFSARHTCYLFSVPANRTVAACGWHFTSVRVCFMRDETSARFSRQERELFPLRWIGRGGAVTRSALSLGPNTVDLCLRTLQESRVLHRGGVAGCPLAASEGCNTVLRGTPESWKRAQLSCASCRELRIGWWRTFRALLLGRTLLYGS